MEQTIIDAIQRSRKSSDRKVKIRLLKTAKSLLDSYLTQLMKKDVS